MHCETVCRVIVREVRTFVAFETFNLSNIADSETTISSRAHKSGESRFKTVHDPHPSSATERPPASIVKRIPSTIAACYSTIPFISDSIDRSNVHASIVQYVSVPIRWFFSFIPDSVDKCCAYSSDMYRYCLIFLDIKKNIWVHIWILSLFVRRMMWFVHIDRSNKFVYQYQLSMENCMNFLTP